MVTTLLLVILGFVAGLLGALTGIGGGVLLTPFLALHFGIPIRQAIGTSLCQLLDYSATRDGAAAFRSTFNQREATLVDLKDRDICGERREMHSPSAHRDRRNLAGIMSASEKSTIHLSGR